MRGARMHIDRRLFLVAGGAGLVLGIGGCGPGAPVAAARKAPDDPRLWLSIAPDNTVTLRLNASDIGQGAQTGIAQIVADELDADWASIRVEMAPVTDAYMIKDDNYFTGGSSSIREQFTMFARAAAAARLMLLEAAAQRWSVERASLTTKDGTISHRASNRSLPYGALAADAAQIAVPVHVPLKASRDRRFVGRPVARLDIPDKVRGRATYGIDVRLPGMLFATVAQCPYFDGRLLSLDKTPALGVRGVRAVVTFENAVVVVADKFWIASRALSLLSPVWSKPAGPIVSDGAMFVALRDAIGAEDSMVSTIDAASSKQTIAHVNAALAGSRTFEAEYRVPLLAHAAMEPMNATARTHGKTCELWAPMQSQKSMRDDVAKALGMPRDAVTVHTTKSGGGFGRRLETDYGVLAARTAQKVGRPVKLIWSREEDFSHDFYRPASACRLRAALSADNRITAIDYSGATTNDTAVGGIARNYPAFDVVVRQKRLPVHLPVGAWRSVDPSITIFFLESFVDEIAHASRVDPLVFRQRHLVGKARELRVLDTVAQMADWGHAPAGRSQGLAFFASAYWGTTVAEVVELSVDASRKIALHRVFCAIDPGLAVNPDQVASQAEGGILMGLSAALSEAITLKDGRVDQTNFDSYSVLRLRSAPEIFVRVLQTDGAPPGGAGEPPVPPAAPALANAIFAATGKRVRTLPIVRAGFTV
jgi:isoquinoline 1-oxidoreductase beta subunit